MQLHEANLVSSGERLTTPTIKMDELIQVRTVNLLGRVTFPFTSCPRVSIELESTFAILDW